MKKFIFIILIFIGFSLFGSCSYIIEKENSSCPKLRIENVNYSYSIKSVTLLGYNFEPLEINSNQSQTFILNNGMQGGYSNILVYISDGVHQPISKNCNFKNGKTTVIKVKMTPSYVMYLE